MKISKEEFILNYCKNSNITINYFNKYFIALKCNCNKDNCIGWACVNNDELSIKIHNELYK